MQAKMNFALSKDVKAATTIGNLTPREEKQIMKVAVLTEPYFPKQKLSIKFNNVVLQHMELESN